MNGGGYLVWVWLVYGALSIGLTYFLARTLFKHGAAFLQNVLKDAPEMAHAVNVLLVVGFYMLNLGYAALLLRPGRLPAAGGPAEATAYLVSKLGVLLVSLGLIHFVNMFVIYQLGSQRRVRRPDPVPGYWPPPPVPAPPGP